MFTNFVDYLGAKAINICEEAGNIGLFFYEAVCSFSTGRFKLKKLFEQMNHIGVDSFGVTVLTGAAIGGVLAYHSYQGLHRFNGEQFVGPLIFLAMVREFGPVLTALMVTGRAGSAMTAEIGSMRITEQIDALQTLCIDVRQYLIIPRILAATIIFPFLTIFCSLVGITVGYLMSVNVLHINGDMYMEQIRSNVVLSDITSGLIKASVFGFIMSLVCCYKGFNTKKGSQGLGISTTQAVVLANVTILIADYLLTAVLF